MYDIIRRFSIKKQKDRITPHVKFCVVQLDMRLVGDELCEMSGVN